MRNGAKLSAVIILLVAIVTTSTGLALAAPDPANSYVVWRDLLCIEGRPFVCPSGDGSSLFVSVRDELNQPLAGIQVRATLTSSCPICVCPGAVAVTDMNGEATIRLYVGLDSSLNGDCCIVTVEVKTGGNVTIPWPGGLDTDTRGWVSPDLTGDCYVGVPDDIVISGGGPLGCSTDYNCDGVTNMSDYAIFMQHYDHGCPVSPVEHLSWGSIKALHRP